MSMTMRMIGTLMVHPQGYGGKPAGLPYQAGTVSRCAPMPLFAKKEFQMDAALDSFHGLHNDRFSSFKSGQICP
jgi:hypothetical protein